MKYKRGSHVGVILSFLIFVIFLGFMYITLQPAIKINEGKKSTYDYLKIALIENLSDILLSETVVVNKSVNGNCIELKYFNETFVDNDGNSLVNSSLITEGESGRIFPAVVSESSLFIDRSANNTNRLFKIFMSGEFADVEGSSMSGCIALDKGKEYSVGAVTSGQYLFESKVEKLKEAYDSDYDALKKKLNIPAGDEFGFGFEFANGTRIEAKKGETKQSIYIDDTPEQYVNKNGDVLIGTLTISVW